MKQQMSRLSHARPWRGPYPRLLSLLVPFSMCTVPAHATDAPGTPTLDAAGPHEPVATATPPDKGPATVVVTATRRREPVREVPIQIDILSPGTLERAGAKTMTDYLADQPGVDVKTTGGAGTGAINVRGMSSGDQTISMVSTYVDDVAVGSSSAYAAGATTALDMTLLDLNHIELLRGPQGTLYGAGAMGGLLKYVTNQPVLDDLTADLTFGYSHTRGAASGNTVAGVFNLPLKSDLAAMRIALYRDKVGGYVDAGGPAGGNDINGGRSTGARVSVLVEPSRALSLRLTSTMNQIERDGSDYADYDIRTGQRANARYARALALREPYSVKSNVTTADVEYDMGWARFNSISSAQRSHFAQQSDYSYVYGPAIGLPTVRAEIDARVKKTTQEFRLTSPGRRTLEWIGGFYYDHEAGGNHQADTGVTEGDLLAANLPSTFIEQALYGDLTWNLSKRMAVTAGMRMARNQQEFGESGGGLLVGGAVDLAGHSKESSKTYLATAKYALDSTSNVYARAASGYRPGGPNAVALGADGVAVAPTTFQHDTLWSYEAGYKSELLERTLSVQAALYLIHWKQIQQFFAVNGVNVIVNGGRATSKGAEFSARWRPNDSWDVNLALAYNEARLTEDAVGLARSGARLPNGARLSGSLNATYNFQLAGRDAYVGFAERLVGERNAGFDGSAALPNYRLPGYGLTDLQAGMSWDRYELGLYVRNLLDRRAQLGAETNLVEAGVGGPVLVNESRPLTLGLNMKLKF